MHVLSKHRCRRLRI